MNHNTIQWLDEGEKQIVTKTDDKDGVRIMLDDGIVFRVSFIQGELAEQQSWKNRPLLAISEVECRNGDFWVPVEGQYVAQICRAEFEAQKACGPPVKQFDRSYFHDYNLWLAEVFSAPLVLDVPVDGAIDLNSVHYVAVIGGARFSQVLVKDLLEVPPTPEEKTAMGDEANHEMLSEIKEGTHENQIRFDTLDRSVDSGFSDIQTLLKETMEKFKKPFRYLTEWMQNKARRKGGNTHELMRIVEECAQKIATEDNMPQCIKLRRKLREPQFSTVFLIRLLLLKLAGDDDGTLYFKKQIQSRTISDETVRNWENAIAQTEPWSDFERALEDFNNKETLGD